MVRCPMRSARASGSSHVARNAIRAFRISFIVSVTACSERRVSGGFGPFAAMSFSLASSEVQDRLDVLDAHGVGRRRLPGFVPADGLRERGFADGHRVNSSLQNECFVHTLLIPLVLPVQHPERTQITAAARRGAYVRPPCRSTGLATDLNGCWSCNRMTQFE
jgi:hypothetical protein